MVKLAHSHSVADPSAPKLLRAQDLDPRLCIVPKALNGVARQPDDHLCRNTFPSLGSLDASATISTEISSPLNVVGDRGRYSVASFYLRLLTDFCEEYGLDATKLLARDGLDAGILEDGGARIEIESFLLMCEEAARQLGISHLGLHLGQRMKPCYLGPYWYALLSCSNARERVADIMRYSTLAIDAGRNLIEERDGQIILTWESRLPSAHVGNRLFVELVLSSYLSTARQLSGQPDLVPLWVTLPWVAPSDPAPYANRFGCTLRFEAERPSIGFAPYPFNNLMYGNMDVHASMAALCERLLKRMDEAGGQIWLSTCRRVIADALEVGVPNLKQVADKLKMTPSSLRLQLSKSMITFHDLVDSLRRDLAIAYLHDPVLDLVDITHMLGFSEQSALQRAFKRWTGVTPGEYRRQRKDAYSTTVLARRSDRACLPRV